MREKIGRFKNKLWAQRETETLDKGVYATQAALQIFLEKRVALKFFKPGMRDCCLIDCSGKGPNVMPKVQSALYGF